MAQSNSLHVVDWSKIPEPVDDGGTRHLMDLRVPSISLVATSGATVDLAAVDGRVVIYAYPRTGVPGQIGLVDDWDMIPGARGCTPQSCAFRDHFSDLKLAGADAVFGLSTQDADYQREMVERLHLPFPVLSDAALALVQAMRLPTLEVGGQTLIKRLAWVQDAGVVKRVFYPVFPPDQNAADVLAWLKDNRRS